MESNLPAAKACLDVIQHAPPSQSEKALEKVRELISSNKELSRELEQEIHLPLRVSTDPNTDGKPFLLCPFNSFHDSYRSPWSNTFHPPLNSSLRDETSHPMESLLNLELAFGEVWDAYRQHYYGNDAVGSVYVCEKESMSFVACLLLQKHVKTVASLEQGQWDSAHVCIVGPVKDGAAEYNLQSTVLVTMSPSVSPDDKSHSSLTNVSSRMTKETTQSALVLGDYDHVKTIGKMVEDVEIELRSNMEAVHFPKTQQVVESVRKEKAPMAGNPMMNHTAMLNHAVLARAALNKKATS